MHDVGRDHLGGAALTGGVVACGTFTVGAVENGWMPKRG
jgi:hypothetical protein